MTSTSKFIVFEGIDGAGKSTQAALLAEALSRSGIDVVQTRNPGGCAEAEAIRNIVFDDRFEWTPLSEVFLMIAAMHVSFMRLISDKSDKWIICDRYYWSTVAYQCAGAGVSKRDADDLFDITPSIQPDLVIVLDIPPDVSTERTASRTNGNRYDRSDPKFRTSVRQSYLDQHEASPWSSVVIDGTKPQNVVHQAVMAAVRGVL